MRIMVMKCFICDKDGKYYQTLNIGMDSFDLCYKCLDKVKSFIKKESSLKKKVKPIKAPVWAGGRL